MNILAISILVFLAGYILNMFYITVLYHRALAHQSVQLSPFMMKWVGWTGNWVTGMEPAAWVAMHRLHHAHSDQELDPHSPVHQGVWGVALGQLRGYEKAIRELTNKNPEYTSVVGDLPFTVSSLRQKKLWMMPYVLHVLIGLGLWAAFGSFWVGLAYYVGISTHPVQGWMVNALAHRYGYRNYDTSDNSRNNTLVAWLVFGEGFQNNHHTFPKSACFSRKFWEIDLGYVLCHVASWFRILRIVPEPYSSRS